jgi:DNA-binding transcriptional MerR regulator
MLSVLSLSNQDVRFMGEPCWRIDELAQRAGLTVDTIRYYSREGLLQAPVKQGRNRLYSQEHYDRLERIGELRSQRFSLAAIRAVVDADRPGLEGLFATTGHEYTLDELTEKADLDAELVERLRKVGILPDPSEFGGDAYDDTDLGLLRAVGELRAIGMTPDIVVSLGRIYVEHFTALQQEVLAMLSGHDTDWDREELVRVQQSLTANSQRMTPAVDQVLSYVHHRTLQRLTLEAATHTPVRDADEPTDVTDVVPPS